MLTETTEKLQTQTVSFEVDLHHSPQKVWRALTDPSLLAEWLLPATGLALTPGTQFTFNAEPQPGWDGVVHCRLVEIDEPSRLTMTWVVGDIDTVVTFTLAPTDTGTLLSIVQSGFREHQRQNFGGARYGWKLMGGKLIDLLERTP
jgi:uncharacterized protein YndB with AHSA1/START domain